MKIDAYLVDNIEMVELEDGSKKIVNSEKINTIKVPTLPYVNQLTIKIDLTDLVVGERTILEVHILDHKEKLIGFSGAKKIKAEKASFSMLCQITMVHTSISDHVFRLFVDGEIVSTDTYCVEFDSDSVTQKSRLSS
ncbi:hypothetical protein NQ117_00865 [Paenibacillus sp. SC116]|uniref:hypothetical protein n=1 Tax=Paenibacillus sp. SC116 TaxID=2968986 RepID=UPI00215A5108|nr:hypothetical protein [Paenibacillus sp. SC116]MCR8842224.1 hypothetical protein [Paenibacillus sp. SC116]